MNDFDEILAKVAADLDLSGEVRVKVISELNADLEGMRDSALAAGAGNEEAVRRALDFVDTSPEAVAALARIHGSASRQLLERVPQTMRSRLERALIVAVGLAALYAGLRLFSMGRYAFAGGLTAWCSVVVLAMTLTYAVCGFYRYRIANDHRPRCFHDRARVMSLVLAGQFGLGVAGLLRNTVHEWLLLEAMAGMDGKSAVKLAIMTLMRQAGIVAVVGLGALVACWLRRRYQSQGEALEFYEKTTAEGAVKELSPVHH